MSEAEATHWLLKSAPQLTQNPPVFLHENRQLHGEIFHMNLPFRRSIAIHHPDFIKQVLVTHNKRYEKDYSTKRLGYTLGQGLIVSEGDFWRRQRRIAQPAFHRQRLAHMAEVMVSLAQHRMDAWADKPEIEVSQEMMELTSGIAAQTLFGTAFARESDFGEALLYAMRFITWTFKWPIMPPLWLHTSKIRRYHQANKRLM